MCLIGKWNHLIVTRPDISFPVSIVIQFMTSTYDSHLDAVCIKNNDSNTVILTAKKGADLEENGKENLVQLHIFTSHVIFYCQAERSVTRSKSYLESIANGDYLSGERKVRPQAIRKREEKVKI